MPRHPDSIAEHNRTASRTSRSAEKEMVGARGDDDEDSDEEELELDDEGDVPEGGMVGAGGDEEMVGAYEWETDEGHYDGILSKADIDALVSNHTPNNDYTHITTSTISTALAVVSLCK